MTDIQNIPYNIQEDTKYANACAIASNLGPEADSSAIADLLQNQEEDVQMNESSEQPITEFPRSDEEIIALVCDAMAGYLGWA